MIRKRGECKGKGAKEVKGSNGLEGKEKRSEYYGKEKERMKRGEVRGTKGKEEKLREERKIVRVKVMEKYKK